MQKKKKAGSLYLTMVLIFNCIMLLFLLTAFRLYSWGSETVSSEIAKTMELQTGFLRDLIDKDLQRTLSQCESVLFDQNLQTLAIAQETEAIYDVYQAYYNFRNRLATIADSNSYLSDVVAYIPYYGRVSSGKGYFDSAACPSELEQAENGVLTTVDGVLYLPVKFYRDWYQPDNNEKPIVIAAQLDQEKIQTALQLLDSYNYSDNYFLLADGSLCLSNAPAASEVLPPAAEQAALRDGTLTISKSADSQFQIVSLVNMEKHLSILNENNRRLLLLCAVWIVVNILFVLYAYRRVYRPIRMINETARRVESGSTDIRIDYKNNDEFRIIFDSFERIAAQSEELLRQQYEQELLLKEAENVHAQLQIKPHFLYNCFFLINSMVKLEDYEGLAEFTTELSNYYRYITDTDSKCSTLGREIEFAVSFSKICALRFKRRLSVELPELPPYAALPVPRLILQPIVENAFKYAFEDRAEDGILRMSCRCLKNCVLVEVEDNGTHLTEQAIEELQRRLSGKEDGRVGGLQNINRRIQYSLPAGSGVTVRRSALGGLQVTVKFIISAEALLCSES